ncbi:protein shank isoform X2 [Eurytemora carolleeae]|uniref:protein shank isoform X2 n=1 Tax=Eurytemora carolleeae TaxID=1294199 RepID=UPI000C763147|nr:protein shank isoform X2 [Eurytemora carolleeae]|eukprot:XP_023340013.1 protein shank-like isoform X2 [Eurytemora affinis]
MEKSKLKSRNRFSWSPGWVGVPRTRDKSLLLDYYDSISLSSNMEETVEDLILIQVKVPDINVEKTLQFSRCSLIWEAKQQILAALPKELDEGFNYGLFLPPNNCKAGKFMDEERTLSEYPFQSTLNTIEMKYKRKVYKELNLDQKQLKQINSKSNQKKFIEYISSNNVEKISKLINKGLDPNFHCPDSGETPLSLCTRNPKSSRSILVLVNGGALIDYRTKDGSTAMHRGVSGNNYEAVKTMLDLGGSPNYRDGKGLTPLYLSVAGNTDPNITQVLLHERAVIGTQDLQGWAEVHQCCRSGLVQHLEYLLFYQADCNARNASGNTPLHVCAVNNQDGCARLLLFRGADREVLNYAGQTAYQVQIQCARRRFSAWHFHCRY